jgi:hypothetical protein
MVRPIAAVHRGRGAEASASCRSARLLVHGERQRYAGRAPQSVPSSGHGIVLTRGGGETERFGQVVRAKIGQFTSATANPEARGAGLTYAKHMVEQVIAQIHAEGQLQKRLLSAARREVPPRAVAAAPHLPGLLN